MDRVVWCILLAFLIASINVESKDENKRGDVHFVHLNAAESSAVSGLALEMILSRQDNMLHQIQKIQQDVQEQCKIISDDQQQNTHTLRLLGEMQQEMQQQKKDETHQHIKSQEAIAEIRAKKDENEMLLGDISQKLNTLKSDLSTQREEISKNRNENLKQMEQVKSDQKQMLSMLNIHRGSYRSCKDVHTKASGMYNIRGKDTMDTFVAYCEQDKDGGGWMVIQHRFDGSLSFDRNWTDYKNGFGEVDGEHWLGLERIHQFTKGQDCELLIEMKDFYDNYKYARYSSFAIGSESEQYNLKILGEYRGTAGDSLRYHKGMKFSTPDRDNDLKPNFNCATIFSGGWWFKDCHFAFLNGLYQNVSGQNQSLITWISFSNEYRGLSYSRMLIRPLN